MSFTMFGTENFTLLYYSVASLGAVAAAFWSLGARVREGRMLLVASVAMLVVVYLFGMCRDDGVDFGNYAAAYYGDSSLIPDIGYRVLTAIAAATGVSLSSFFLLQGMFTIFVLVKLSQKLDANVAVVVFIYLLHLAVVRDFSQSRIGLAVAVYFYSLTIDGKRLNRTLAVFAATIHLTVIPLMLFWPYCLWLKKRKFPIAWVAATSFLIVFFSMRVLDLAAMVDPRILIYQQWNESLYGAPVESYGALLRSLFVLSILALFANRRNMKVLLPFVMMEIFSCAIFLGLSDLAIFAYRLSNVMSSFYPLALGILMNMLNQNRPGSEVFYSRLVLGVGLFIFSVFLAVRPGSIDIVRDINIAGF